MDETNKLFFKLTEDEINGFYAAIENIQKNYWISKKYRIHKK